MERRLSDFLDDLNAQIETYPSNTKQAQLGSGNNLINSKSFGSSTTPLFLSDPVLNGTPLFSSGMVSSTPVSNGNHLFSSSMVSSTPVSNGTPLLSSGLVSSVPVSNGTPLFSSGMVSSGNYGCNDKLRPTYFDQYGNPMSEEDFNKLFNPQVGNNQNNNFNNFNNNLGDKSTTYFDQKGNPMSEEEFNNLFNPQSNKIQNKNINNNTNNNFNNNSNYNFNNKNNQPATYTDQYGNPMSEEDFNKLFNGKTSFNNNNSNNNSYNNNINNSNTNSNNNRSKTKKVYYDTSNREISEEQYNKMMENFTKNIKHDGPKVDVTSSEFLQKFRKDCTDYHNMYRSKHHVEPLVQDPRLDQVAQKYAEKLALLGSTDHSDLKFGNETMGENIFSQIGSLVTADETVRKFYEEINDYNWSNPSSVKVAVGHFKQLVWKGTKRIGCGVAEKNNQYYVVVNYYPAGNVYGEDMNNVFPA